MPIYKLAILLAVVITASGVTVFAVTRLMPPQGLSPLWTGLILSALVAVSIAVRLWPTKSRDNEHN